MPTLNWIGKDADVDHHKQVPFRLLKCNDKLSADDDETSESRMVYINQSGDQRHGLIYQASGDLSTCYP